MRRGEIWWADLPEPQGSEPGFTHPVVILQSDRFSNSDLRIVVVAAVTSNLRLGDMPGNVYVERAQSSLPRDSVINVTQIITVDESILRERVARLPENTMSDVDAGLMLVLGL